MSTIKELKLESHIRPATMNDIEEIQNLCLQLGYQPTLSLVHDNLFMMIGHQDYEVVVTEHLGKVVGWMTLYRRLRIEDIPFLQVAALVTDEAVRGQGHGQRLIAYAESRARSQNLNFLGLHSSQRRTEAHQFYENQGFEKLKDSFFFKKDIV